MTKDENKYAGGINNEILLKAESLAGLLRQSKEYNQYLSAKAKLEQDEYNINVLKEMKKQELHIRMSDFVGEGILNREELLEEMYMALSLNPVVSEYLNAEYSFNRLLGELQKIFGDILGVGQETAEAVPLFTENKSNKLVN